MARRYDSSRRAARATASRARILDAARDLFTSQGFASTTVANIAEHAGVAPATVHAMGTKGALLLDIVMREFSGGGAVLDTDTMGSAFAEQNTDRALDAASAFLTAAHARSARLWAVVHAASAVDDVVAQRLEELQRQRRAELEVAAGWFVAAGLAETSCEDHVADVLEFATDSATYRHFVADCNWSDDEYRHWLRTQLAIVGRLSTRL